jgi:hypothetical protein
MSNFKFVNLYLKTSFDDSVIRKLIDYCTVMPVEDTLQEGHRYPYNACELLCSDSNFILNKLIDIVRLDKNGNIIPDKVIKEPTEEDLDETLEKVSKRLDDIQIINEGGEGGNAEGTGEHKEIINNEDNSHKEVESSTAQPVEANLKSENLEYFFKFVQGVEELNFVLAGYF